MKRLLIVIFICTSFSIHAAKPITLTPSGDISGIVDQQNMQAALDGAADSDTQIRFENGTFYINGGVSATHFTGKIEGNGQDNTIIVAVGNGDPLKRNSVFLFNDSQFTMSKLTINVPGDALYLDSSPGLGISDGGAAIDIIGGEATINQVKIVSPGPFLRFGEESLETGILVSGCNGMVNIDKNDFQGIKRAVIFTPIVPSHCDLSVKNNTFVESRGSVFALGGSPEAINDSVSIKNNRFVDTLTGDMFFGNNVLYPISVESNKFSNNAAAGNPAIFVRDVNAKLDVSNNAFDTDHVSQTIAFISVLGETSIKNNTFRTESAAQTSRVLIENSDNVTLSGNNFKKSENNTGFDLTTFLTFGVYGIVGSTNVTIKNEVHQRSNLANCQVLNIPFIDTSNSIDNDLIQCEFAE